jgi:IS30 family transposase
MTKHYQHLTEGDRDKIYLLLQAGATMTNIGLALGRDRSTIYREIRRNASPEYQHYLPHWAQQRSQKRKSKAVRQRRRLKNAAIEAYVRKQLAASLSPELMAGRIGQDLPGQRISHEAIYQYIYHQNTPGRTELIECLRRAHRKRKNRAAGRKQRKTKIPGRVPIECRPKRAEQRSQVGHWEGDTLVSRKSKAALCSLVERKTRLLYLSKLPAKEAKVTARTMIRRLRHLPSAARRTITLDNGTENAQHQIITKAIKTKCYFATPYHAWERGTNEYVNGLVRWFLPKGTDFSKISPRQIKRIESIINNRPMKCLGYKSPLEVARVALRG